MNKADLVELGLTEEQINKVRAINGADIENAKKDLKAQVADKDKAIADLTEQVKSLEGDSEQVKALQEKVDAFEKSEKERAEHEKMEKADKELTDKITELFGDAEFTSDYVRNGLIADIKKKHAEDNTAGLKDIYESLTKDQEGIFKNKQQEKLNLPGTNKQKEEVTDFKNFF